MGFGPAWWGGRLGRLGWPSWATAQGGLSLSLFFVCVLVLFFFFFFLFNFFF